VILVDTSVWIDHLRRGDHDLATLLESRRVLIHPFVIGELALGRLRERDEILELLKSLPLATRALDEEVLAYIEHHAIDGLGIGYVDAHLMAATQITPGASLWTRDQRLLSAAVNVRLATVSFPI
jgi:predicted nucleic acid-binding protein